MKNWVLGITGGIGSGKSTVLRLFAEKGIEAIDTDQASRLVVSQGSPALNEISAHFGTTILLSNGELDRAALRQVIFDMPKERQWLEQLLHPLIRQQTVNFLNQATSPYVILVSPLLIETNQTSLINRLLVIDVPEELQIKRSIKRDQSSESQIKAIMQSQLSRSERLNYADDIIINEGSMDYLTKEVDRLHQYYLTLSQQKIT